jgi:hypothetical protein
MHVGLISCTKKKRDPAEFNARAMRARDLYIGNSFISGRSILEQVCDRWYILSAKYGLIRPDAAIEPYDLALNDMSVTQYGSWCERMALQVTRMRPDKVTIIAPDLYAEYLVKVLDNSRIEIDRRPRVDIHDMEAVGLGRWYMACRQCGMCGPFRRDRDDAVKDAVGHPCRVELKRAD